MARLGVAAFVIAFGTPVTAIPEIILSPVEVLPSAGIARGELESASLESELVHSFYSSVSAYLGLVSTALVAVDCRLAVTAGVAVKMEDKVCGVVDIELGLKRLLDLADFLLCHLSTFVISVPRFVSYLAREVYNGHDHLVKHDFSR